MVEELAKNNQHISKKCDKRDIIQIGYKFLGFAKWAIKAEENIQFYKNKKSSITGWHCNIKW